MPEKLKLKVISVLTHHDGYSKMLEKQMQDLKLDYEFLAFGEKWQGWKWRTEIIINRLKNLDPDKYIVALIDGHDVLCFDDEKTIIDKYLKINKPIILSVNDSVKNQMSLTMKYMLDRYINGGIYIGNPKLIIELFDNIVENYYYIQDKNYDDEEQINKFYYRNKNPKHLQFIKDNLYLDKDFDFVLNDIKWDHLIVNNNLVKIVNKQVVFNKIKPSFMHNVRSFYSELLDNDKKFKRVSIESMHYFTYLSFILLLFVLILLILISK